MKCPICGGAELISGPRDIPHSYKGHDTIIKDVMGAHCPACDEFIPIRKDGIRLSEEAMAFNTMVDENVGLPERIALIRKKLGLTQQEASAIFGGGANAFFRYERGYTAPSLALLKLLDVLDRHPELLTEVRDLGAEARVA